MEYYLFSVFPDKSWMRLNPLAGREYCLILADILARCTPCCTIESVSRGCAYHKPRTLISNGALAGALTCCTIVIVSRGWSGRKPRTMTSVGTFGQFTSLLNDRKYQRGFPSQI